MNDSNRKGLRATIEAYLGAVRVVKQQLFSALIVSSEYCPLALFLITCSLLSQGGMGDLLQGQAEDLIQYLMDKVASISSRLDPMSEDSPCEMPGKRSCPVIWEWFDLLAPIKCSQCYHLSIRSLSLLDGESFQEGGSSQ